MTKPKTKPKTKTRNKRSAPADVGWPTAEQVLLDCKTHPCGLSCGRCQKDTSRIAIVDLVYVHEVCHCKVADYPHLAQRAYHKDCYLEKYSS